eukprot:6695725-Pyramimonas_sp.AAC.1
MYAEPSSAGSNLQRYQSEGAERSFTVPGCVAEVGLHCAEAPLGDRTLLLSGTTWCHQTASPTPELQQQRLPPDTSSQ